MNSPRSRLHVSWWVRLLAWAVLSAAGVVLCGIGHHWHRAGVMPVVMPDAVTSMLCAFVFVVFGWVAIVGKVPGFFAIGAQGWPLRSRQVRTLR
ncbi:hypothetical protein [Uliginosibacterium sp. H1]|uniref:hypothetical protein n=1 Tax=Uliginosibacterium sp. H1 TaxID=3114757 RepID=UPI002E19D6E7|nr:hypothetical protein [Uliginosibacterium sp. H1]